MTRFTTTTAGYSIVELIVTLAIMTVITGLALANHNKFSTQVLLTNLAYDIALSVRQAQVYGLSFREFGAGSGVFETGYGVFFDPGAPASYILFSDVDDDDLYDGAGEAVRTYEIQRGNRIANICATPVSGTEVCTVGGGIQFLNITFDRPDPDATFRTNQAGVEYTQARIVIESIDGNQRQIDVTNVGQIAVVETE